MDLTGRLVGLALLCVLQSIRAESHDEKRSDSVSTGYIEYAPGTLNIILTAPHGGNLRPQEIPIRDIGCWDYRNAECIWSHNCGVQDESRCKAKTVRDMWTSELTTLVSDELYLLMGERPTTVINLLHRNRLDANRDMNEATFGVSVVEKAWEEFHQYINQSKRAFGGVPGLVLDMHAHSHTKQRAEIGYLVSKSNLNYGSIDPRGTSIRGLYERMGGDIDDLIRGTYSLGGFLQRESYDALPSPNHYRPNGDRYFSGGFNTRMHGSRAGGFIDAIQIESPYSFRVAENRGNYARALAHAIKRFVDMYY